MQHVIRVHETGGPERLIWEKIDIPAPKGGEVLVRNGAIGLNFLDTHFRSGRYPVPLPFVPGHEGAGTIEAIGPGVEDFAVGDRVGYIGPLGSYGEFAVRPLDRLVKLPDDMTEIQSASMLLKGTTAEFLTHRTYKVKRGETILVHAAAGGVGQILCQWSKHLGARVIGTVGSAEKRAVAERAGCDHVIVHSEEDFVKRVRDITRGELLPVVYDGVGGEIFTRSLDCLARYGVMVAFGMASGATPLLDVQSLGAKGSLYVTRPGVNAYLASAAELRASATLFFEAVRKKIVVVNEPRIYALEDAAQAHVDLEASKLTGSTVLLP